MDFSWTEEQEIWRRTVRDFAQKKIKPRVREIDTNKKIPDEIIKDMARLGLLAPTVSKEYGGQRLTGQWLALLQRNSDEQISASRFL